MKLDSRPALRVLSLPRHSFPLLETKRGGNYSKCGLLQRQAFVRSTLTVWKSGAILVWAPAKLCSWLDLWPFSSLGFSGDKGEQEESSIWTSCCSSSPSDPNSVQWGQKKKGPHETFPPCPAFWYRAAPAFKTCSSTSSVLPWTGQCEWFECDLTVFLLNVLLERALRIPRWEQWKYL